MAVRYRVTLTQEERAGLGRLIASGKGAARRLKNARILLKADQSEDGPGWSDERIAEAIECSSKTVVRLRERFVEQGLDAALDRKPTSRTYLRKLDGAAEAHLIAIACSSPPEGHARWTLRLLADRVVAAGIVEDLSHETVRRVLKKTNSNRG